MQEFLQAFTEILGSMAGTAWGIPTVVVLVGTGIYLTFRMGLMQIRGFGHAVALVSGKYDHKDDPGEVSHFQALSTALSATVGTGNIAGVATAIALGGPGAVFWMWVTAFVGMATKFTSCTLAVHFRSIHDQGEVSGGPMHTIAKGLNFYVLAAMFSLFTLIASFGIGNMVQANSVADGLGFVLKEIINKEEVEVLSKSEIKTIIEQSYQEHGKFLQANALALAFNEKIKQKHNQEILETSILTSLSSNYLDKHSNNILSDIAIADAYKGLYNLHFNKIEKQYHWILGLILAIAVGLVILGGIKRIANVASIIVPFMAIFYVGAALIILLLNIDKIPSAFVTIFNLALNPWAVGGGAIGAAIQYGVARGVFSNEAGLGSAPMAHAAAKTKEPVREGLVAMLEPFIDTIIICTMTALVIVIVGAWGDDKPVGLTGAALSAFAFKEVLGLAGALVVGFGLMFFAYSTMIAWSYYGDRSAEYLFGHRAVLPYRIIYTILVFVGATVPLNLVWNFADVANVFMAIPNLISLIFLTALVKKLSDDYFKRQFNTNKE